MPANNLPPWAMPPARRAQSVAFLRAGKITEGYGSAGAPGDYSWPTQPPHNVPIDLPARLSRGRSRLAWMQQFAGPDGAIDWLALLTLLLEHIDHKVFFITQPFSQGVAAALVRPEEDRRYLFIQNTHALQDLFVGFGFAPTAINCVRIGPQGFYEPLWVPQNDIQFAASGAATTGAIIYANA